MSVASKGGFGIDCDHGGAYFNFAISRRPRALRGGVAMKDHPFGVSPEPYASDQRLPAGFGGYCKIIK